MGEKGKVEKGEKVMSDCLFVCLSPWLDPRSVKQSAVGISSDKCISSSNHSLWFYQLFGYAYSVDSFSPCVAKNKKF